MPILSETTESEENRPRGRPPLCRFNPKRTELSIPKDGGAPKNFAPLGLHTAKERKKAESVLRPSIKRRFFFF
jgi:hypothetical protein